MSNRSRNNLSNALDALGQGMVAWGGMKMQTRNNEIEAMRERARIDLQHSYRLAELDLSDTNARARAADKRVADNEDWQTQWDAQAPDREAKLAAQDREQTFKEDQAGLERIDGVFADVKEAEFKLEGARNDLIIETRKSPDWGMMGEEAQAEALAGIDEEFEKRRQEGVISGAASIARIDPDYWKVDKAEMQNRVASLTADSGYARSIGSMMYDKYGIKPKPGPGADPLMADADIIPSGAAGDMPAGMVGGAFGGGVPAGASSAVTPSQVAATPTPTPTPAATPAAPAAAAPVTTPPAAVAGGPPGTPAGTPPSTPPAAGGPPPGPAPLPTNGINPDIITGAGVAANAAAGLAGPTPDVLQPPGPKTAESVGDTRAAMTQGQPADPNVGNYRPEENGKDPKAATATLQARGKRYGLSGAGLDKWIQDNLQRVMEGTEPMYPTAEHRRMSSNGGG